MEGNVLVFFDGTWDGDCPEETGRGETNVPRLHRLFVEDGNQRACYLPGVGTGGVLDRMVGGLTGAGLSLRIQRGYTWLAANWRPGDRIFLFGFSRGAYSARCLAGMIRKCGLVLPEHIHRTQEAYDLYLERTAAVDGPAAEQFRRLFSRTVDIHFLGVWETVGTLGIPHVGPLDDDLLVCQFHDNALSRTVRHSFHALALDEQHEDLRPSLWDREHPEEGRDMEQRWFVGSHRDVGGGGDCQALSDISLAWMHRKAQACGARSRDPDFNPVPFPADPTLPITERLPALSLVRGRPRKPLQTTFGHETIDENVLFRMEHNDAYREDHRELYDLIQRSREEAP